VRGIMVVVVVAGPVVGEVEVVVVEVDCVAGGEGVVAAAASSLLTSGIFAEFVIVVFGGSQRLV